jgi:hypothetical protein
LQRIGELLFREVIREQVLHTFETRTRRRGKAVHERMLVEEQREIRTELRHGRIRVVEAGGLTGRIGARPS